MAKNIEMNVLNESGEYEVIYPKTAVENILNNKGGYGVTNDDAFEIGDILLSTRSENEMGERWQVCDGREVDGTIYPEYSLIVGSKRGWGGNFKAQTDATLCFTGLKYNDYYLFINYRGRVSYRKTIYGDSFEGTSAQVPYTSYTLREISIQNNKIVCLWTYGQRAFIGVLSSLNGSWTYCACLNTKDDEYPVDGGWVYWISGNTYLIVCHADLEDGTTGESNAFYYNVVTVGTESSISTKFGSNTRQRSKSAVRLGNTVYLWGHCSYSNRDATDYYSLSVSTSPTVTTIRENEYSLTQSYGAIKFVYNNQIYYYKSGIFYLGSKTALSATSKLTISTTDLLYWEIVGNELYVIYKTKIDKYNFSTYTLIGSYTCNLGEIGVTIINYIIVNGNDITVCYAKNSSSAPSTKIWDNYSSIVLPIVTPPDNATYYIKLK